MLLLNVGYVNAAGLNATDFIACKRNLHLYRTIKNALELILQAIAAN